MTNWFLFIFGPLLLVAGAWGRYSLSRQVQPSDAQLAFRHLAEIPASRLGDQVTVEVAAPQSSAWDRIRRSWGEPQYELAVISTSGGRAYQHCLDDLKVQADVLGKPLTAEVGGWLYGFSSAPDSFHCNSSGLKFRIPQGTTATMHLMSVASQRPPDTEMIVVPVWSYTKDKLVGLSIDTDLLGLTEWSMAAGAFLVAVSAFLFLRSRRNSPAPVNAPS